MNTLTKTGPGTAVALSNEEIANQYRRYASRVAPKHIIGTLLKFNKGDYLAGQAGTSVPLGTKFIALVDKMTCGFIKWENGRPADQRMALATSSDAPLRKDLGELDQSEWELDRNGKPKDPWTETTYLPLMAQDGALFTFSTNSFGGRRSTSDLFEAYAVHVLENGDSQYPIVKIGVDSFMSKQFGKVKVPVFAIVDYFDKAKVAGRAVVAPEEEASEDPGYGMDDEIPF